LKGALNVVSRTAKKKRNIRIARLILDNATNEQILKEVNGANIYDVTGMRGFLTSARGRKWAVEKGFVEPKPSTPSTPSLTPQPTEEVKEPSTPLPSPEQHGKDNVPEPIPSPASPSTAQPIQKAVPREPLREKGVPQDKPHVERVEREEAPEPSRTRVSEEVVEVEVLGVPRKLKVSAETLLWYSWFLDGKLPIQKKPFEGSLGDFFDLCVKDFFHSRGVQFVVRFEREVA